MRIAHFVQRYPPALGGSEAYFQRLSRFLAQSGDDVTVWTTVADDLTAFWSPNGRSFLPGVSVDQGVCVRRFPLWRLHGRRWLLKPLSMLPHRLWQWLTLPCNPISFPMWREAGRTTEQYDIVHATAFPYAFPIACGLRLARRLDVPFLLTPFLHLGDPDQPNDRTRRAYTSAPMVALLRQADAIFAQTPSERNAIIQMGVPAEKVILQGLGVDPNDCTGGDRRRARAEWKVPDEAVVIGHLANLSIEKGTVDLLHAVEHLQKSDRECQMQLILAGAAMPNFEKAWQTGKRGPWVQRRGVLSDVDKRDFFAGIDLFALPSRSDSFGLVLLEAWANGVPNIAYRAGGIADVIQDGRDGLLVRAGDVAELTVQLRRLIDDAELRRRLGQNGLKRVQREFRWEEKLRIVRDLVTR